MIPSYPLCFYCGNLMLNYAIGSYHKQSADFQIVNRYASLSYMYTIYTYSFSLDLYSILNSPAQCLPQ